MSGHVIRRVIVRGRVQGVGYRDWTRHVARGRGLEGWVRNRRDGSVEALFSGSDEAVAGMVEACRKGPPIAVVESIEQDEASGTDLALRGDKGFAVLPSA